MFLIMILYGTFFQDLKRLLTLRSFWCKIIFCELINPFTAKEFLIDELYRLASDRVKSISAQSAPTAVKGLRV